MSLYIGIDIGKFSHTACLLSTSLLAQFGRYEVCPTFTFTQSRAGFEKLLVALKVHASVASCSVLVENTGHYGRALEQFLQEHGITVYQVHVQEHTKKKKQKSDKRDAQGLAVLLYNQIERHVLVAEKSQIAHRLVPANDTARLLHGLVQHRQELVRETTRRKNKLIAICDELFPEFTQVYSDPNGASALNLRETFPDPQAIKNASLDALCETRTHTRPSRAQLALLQELAKSTIGTKDKSRIACLLMEQKQLIAELRLLMSHVGALNREIEEAIVSSREGKILTSFSCIGTLQAAMIIACIGSIANFENAAKLRAYAGWSPLQNQTGISKDSMILERGGNRLLKHTLYLVTLNAIQHESKWKDLYDRLVPVKCSFDERTRHYRGRMKVIGRVAGQILTVVYVLLKRDYDLIQRTPVGQELPGPELYDALKHQVKRK